MWDLLQSGFVRNLVEVGVLLPAAVTIILAAAMYWGTRNYFPWRAVVWAPALLTGFLSGYAAIYRNFSFPPRTVLSWLPWVAAAGGATVALADRLGRNYWGYGARGVAAGVSSFVLLWPILRQEAISSGLHDWLTVTVLWSLLWFLLAPHRQDQKLAGTTLLVGTMGLALVAPLSGSILLAQLGATLAVVLAIALLLSIFVAGSRWHSPSADVGILILGALLVDLRFYAGASVAVIAWLLVSLAAGSGMARIIRQRGTVAGCAVAAPGLVSLLPMAVAIWMALRVYRASGGGY